MSLESFVQAAINGLILGLIYVAIAIGPSGVYVADGFNGDLLRAPK